MQNGFKKTQLKLKRRKTKHKLQKRIQFFYWDSCKALNKKNVINEFDTYNRIDIWSLGSLDSVAYGPKYTKLSI